ncbi:MAG: isopenicillin N synthase family dioxygenase [Burkholderiales bacterium]
MAKSVTPEELALYADFDNRFLRADKRFSVVRKPLERLPIIDLSAFVHGSGMAERQKVAGDLREACVDIGFFYLDGHGISAAELEEVCRWAHRFFELPGAQKMKVHCNLNRWKQGYVGVGGANPESNPDKAADLKERFYMNRDCLPGEPEERRGATGASQWLAPDVLPGFEPFMKAHIAKRYAVARHLLHAFSLSLELPETYFDHMYHYLSATFVLNYYPPLDTTNLKETQWSFSPHTDYGSFTLLSQDQLGGLQVRNSAREWIDVPPIPGTFVVNLGNLFATWTNDLYASTLHRAANTAVSSRVAAPFFVSPQGATLVSCLDTCQGPDNPPRYEPVLSEDYIRALTTQATRTGRPGLSPQTTRRLIH